MASGSTLQEYARASHILGYHDPEPDRLSFRDPDPDFDFS